MNPVIFANKLSRVLVKYLEVQSIALQLSFKAHDLFSFFHTNKE